MLTALSSIIVSMLAATPSISEARPVQTVLNHVELYGAEQSKEVAIVETDSRTKKIKVSFYNDICGQFSDFSGHRCMAAASLLRSYELTYKSSKDACGSKVYTAREDKRPVDGALVEITFTDNSLRRCDDMTLGLHVLSLNVETLRGTPAKFVAYNKVTAPELTGDAAIYEALNVEAEVLNPGIAGSSRTRKSVGGLVCYKSIVIVPGAKPSYSCTLTR